MGVVSEGDGGDDGKEDGPYITALRIMLRGTAMASNVYQLPPDSGKEKRSLCCVVQSHHISDN